MAPSQCPIPTTPELRKSLEHQTGNIYEFLRHTDEYIPAPKYLYALRQKVPVLRDNRDLSMKGLSRRFCPVEVDDEDIFENLVHDKFPEPRYETTIIAVLEIRMYTRTYDQFDHEQRPNDDEVGSWIYPTICLYRVQFDERSMERKELPLVYYDWRGKLRNSKAAFYVKLLGEALCRNSIIIFCKPEVEDSSEPKGQVTTRRHQHDGFCRLSRLIKAEAELASRFRKDQKEALSTDHKFRFWWSKAHSFDRRTIPEAQFLGLLLLHEGTSLIRFSRDLDKQYPPGHSQPLPVQLMQAELEVATAHRS